MHGRFHSLLHGTPLLVHRIEELGETCCLMGITRGEQRYAMRR
jgi:hypothetical protein